MKYHETYAHLPSIRTFIRSKKFIPFKIARLFKAVTTWAIIVFLPLSIALMLPWLVTQKPIYEAALKLNIGIMISTALVWGFGTLIQVIIGFPPLPSPQKTAREILGSNPKPNSWITHKDLAQIPYGPKRWPYLPKAVKNKAIQWALEVTQLIEDNPFVQTEENPITNEIQITFLENEKEANEE